MRLSTKLFALYSQALIISFGIINVALNKTYFSQENLGRYYLLSSVFVLKELLTSGVVQNYMVKLSKYEKTKYKLLLVNSMVAYLLKKTPYLFISSLLFCYLAVPEVDIKFILLFALLLSFDYATLWYFPFLESTGNLNRLYRYRSIVNVLAYCSSWIILYLHRSLNSVLIFLLIGVMIKFTLILNDFRLHIFKFNFTRSIPNSLSKLQKKINITFYSSLAHKALLFPLLRPSLGLEALGSFGVVNSIFSSVSSLSREIIRYNLKIYGEMYVSKRKDLLGKFNRDLFVSIFVYCISVLAILFFVYITNFAENLYLFWILLSLSSFYFLGIYIANQHLWFQRIHGKEPMRWFYLTLAVVTLTFPLFTEMSSIFIILSLSTVILSVVAFIFSFRIHLCK